MNVYFLYEAAQRFASLDQSAAAQVIEALAEAAPSEVASKTSRSSADDATDVVRLVRTHDTCLWLGAFSEHRDFTVVSLDDKDHGEELRAKIRAIARVKYRPTIGGLSLNERPADIQESVRALMNDHLTLLHFAGHGGPGNPWISVEGKTHTHVIPSKLLSQQIWRSARRWRTAQARREFKEVMQDASIAPQLVERDGEDVLIIGRKLLEQFEEPLSGAALAAHFAPNQLSRLRFNDEPVEAPEPEIRLRARI
jgi:hypothetical protein